MPEKSKDYFQILGLDRSATLNEVKKAYKKLMVHYHPDKAIASEEYASNPTAENLEKIRNEYQKKSAEFNEAYENLQNILQSDVKRRNYFDQLDGIITPGAPEGFAYHESPFDEKIDLFQDEFSRIRTKDKRKPIDVSIEDAYMGGDIEIEFINELGDLETTHHVIPAHMTNKDKITLQGLGNKTKEGNGDLIITLNIKSNDKYYVSGNNLVIFKLADLSEDYLRVVLPDGTPEKIDLSGEQKIDHFFHKNTGLKSFGDGNVIVFGFMGSKESDRYKNISKNVYEELKKIYQDKIEKKGK